MNHIVNVMRPTKATGSLGERQGVPAVVCREWPCNIKTLSGKEQEAARQNGADAQFDVEGRGPLLPGEGFTLEQCFLTGGTLGERTLNIEFVDDRDFNGLDLRLLCGENK